MTDPRPPSPLRHLTAAYWRDVAEDHRLEREQDLADRGRDRCDDEDERRIEGGCFDGMEDRDA